MSYNCHVTCSIRMAFAWSTAGVARKSENCTQCLPLMTQLQSFRFLFHFGPVLLIYDAILGALCRSFCRYALYGLQRSFTASLNECLVIISGVAAIGGASRRS